MSAGGLDIVWGFIIGTLGFLALAGAFIFAIVRNQKRQLAAEREKMEVIQQSAEKYANLFNNVSDIVFIHDLDGIILQVNETVTRELDFPAGDLVGKPIHSFIPPQYMRYLATYLKSIRRTGNFTGYVPLTAQNGERKIFECRNSIVQEEGTAIAVRGIARNVTEQQDAKRRLIDSEERYRRFFEEDLTGDFIASPDGKILACNAAFARIFGFESIEEAESYSFVSLYEDLPAYDAYIRSVKNRRKLTYHAAKLRRKDNQPVYVVENLIGEFDANEELLQIRGYIFDDTNRKQLEAQFLQAQKMQGIGTLAGGIAHDFNNILSIIMGHISILNQGLASEQPIDGSVDAIEQAVKRGASLVEQILTFARKTDIIFQALDINKIVHELYTLLSGTLPKNVTFSMDLYPKLPFVMADQTQLHQALLNLCVNARDAMPEGGRITVSTRHIPGNTLQTRFPEAKEDGYILLSVSDTGTGMDQRTLDRLFEPFFTTKSRGQGTGLGLAVVYGVISSHDGLIDVQSSPGKGTTFELFFPCSDLPVQKNARSLTQQGLKGKETILIVEDEDMLVDLMKKVLLANDYKILVARDGVEAVDVFRQNQDEIDLVFSDSGLPRQSGWEAFQEMREIRSDIIGVFTSGYFEPGLKKTMTANGIKDFLQKPYSPVKAVRVIREILDREIVKS